MKKYLIAPAILLAALSASAETLSPAAALARAAEELPVTASAARRIAAAAATVAAEPLMTIAKDSRNPELYVFAAGDGLVVASAESEAPALLGYSDFYAPEADMPPAMQWLLNAYAAEIQALRRGDVIETAATSSRADFEPIEPLCSTKWNQGTPYNDLCPKIGSKLTYTGCVATAMAQVLKVMEYPEKCSGGMYNYYWENGQQALSKNFDNVTLDWKNMANTYTASSGSTKRRAVANLMAAVGYASDMNYGTDASGAHGLYACAGLIRNFDYDYTLQYLRRDWFSWADWEAIIYGEIAKGIPVYYDGVNTKEKVGHAFVVDGYNADGFFHLNWGWGGSLDGYFLLTALDPNGQQGIGGSSGGYSDQAGALIGLEKGRTMTDATAPLTFASSGDLTINKSSTIVFGSAFTVSFSPTGGIYNYSPFTVPSVEYALKLTSGDDVYYTALSPSGSTKPYYGVSGFSTSVARGIPPGSYTVTLAVHNPTTDAYYDVYGEQTYVWRKTAVVTNASVKFTDYQEPSDAIAEIEAGDAPVEYFDLGGRSVVNPASGLYIRRQGSNTQTIYIR